MIDQLKMSVWWFVVVGCLGLVYRGTSLSACDGCGCSDGKHVCVPHSHDHGHTHSHDDEPHGSGPKPLAHNVSPAPLTTVVQRFAVVGDTQGGSGTSGLMPDLIASINATSPERLLLAGDLVGTGGSSTWDQWIGHASQFGPGLHNIYMTPGNHDQPSGTDALWRSKFSQTPGGTAWLPDSPTLNGQTGFDQMDYFVDVGSTRFISVTTDTQAFGASNLAPSSLAWMEEALANAETNSTVENVFVFTHHPVTFDSTYTGSTNRAGTQAAMWQSLANDSTKVRSLFTGHWHLYQPSTPDPDNPDIWEVVTGTGGGGLEGRVQQNQHGFTLVDIHMDGRIEATFYGDADGSTNGWNFNDVMDKFTIVDPNPPAAGLVAYYGFNTAGRSLDQATTPYAKQNHGLYNNNAAAVTGGVLGRALSLDGNADYADGATFGDYNMAINGDLTLSIHANFDALAPGSSENTLVAYGSALYNNNTPGSAELESEAVNIAYSLRLRNDKRLEVMWERENGTDVVFASTVAANVNAGEWHHYVVSRDIDTNQLLFFVDGVQLGAPVAFSDNQQPTGGGSGFLHVGSSLYGGGGFDGLLDELTIYNDVILPGEVFTGTGLGDLDGDGDVDLDDFVNEFITRFGDTLAPEGSAATLALGDYDIDGDIDLLDFDAFQTYYFDANPNAAPLVFPEPGALPLIMLGTIFWFIQRRRLTPGRNCAAISGVLAVFMGAGCLDPGPAYAANVIRDYQLAGTFADTFGGPSLVGGGGTLGQNGYSFGNGNGLTLSGWDPTALGEDYSIEFYARFDSFGNGSYGKLLDYKNRTDDRGLYIRNVGGGHHPVFFDVNQNSPTTSAFNLGQFHHVVIARDEPGADDVTLWLDGVQQWSFDDGSSELAVADIGANILHFFVDDGGSENPAGYVDFLRIYDDGVSQAEVNAMVAGLPQYGAPQLDVNKITGDITLHANSGPEPLELRGYQLTSASGALSVSGWTSWDAAGLDGNTWFESNPSEFQLAELNLTSSASIEGMESRSFGDAYGAGIGGPEDLVFQYLAPDNPTPILLPVSYVDVEFIIGDLNFDTNIDGVDWNLFVGGLGADLTGLTMAEAFQMGDMDNDFDNDYDDFILFKDAYETANGPGSFAALIPEPQPETMLLAGVLALSLSRGFVSK